MKKPRNVHIDYARMEENAEYYANPEHRLQLGVNCVELTKAGELLALAFEDIVPDGSYSDYECCVWEEFRRVIRAENRSMIATLDEIAEQNKRQLEIFKEMDQTLDQSIERIAKFKERRAERKARIDELKEKIDAIKEGR